MGSSNGEGLSQLYSELVDAYKKRFIPQNGDGRGGMGQKRAFLVWGNYWTATMEYINKKFNKFYLTPERLWCLFPNELHCDVTIRSITKIIWDHLPMMDAEFVWYGSGPLTDIDNDKYIIYLFRKISHNKHTCL